MGIAIGDPIAFDVAYTKLANGNVMAKAFDNRAGCAAMVDTLRLLQDCDCTIYAVGTVQEEVGLRGAGTAAYAIDPDFALALDVTIAGDVPGVRENDTSVKLGKGPALTLSDSGIITHQRLTRGYLTRKEAKIPLQLERITGQDRAAASASHVKAYPQGPPAYPHLHHSPAAS